MEEYVQILKEMEEFESGFFGDNPNPAQERYEHFLAERVYFKEIREQVKNLNKLELSVKSEIPFSGKKRKRTLSNIQYEEFYKEAASLSQNISLQTEEKRRALTKYYPKFRDKGAFPIRDADSLKVGTLFNNILAYSKKRMKQ